MSVNITSRHQLTNTIVPHTMIYKLLLALLVSATCQTYAAETNLPAPGAQSGVINGGFEDDSLKGWKDWRLRRASLSTNAFAGRHAVQLGPERAMCSQNAVPLSSSMLTPPG